MRELEPYGVPLYVGHGPGIPIVPRTPSATASGNRLMITDPSDPAPSTDTRYG